MADISVGGAIGAGLGLIRRQPLSVMAWGLVRIGFTAAVFAIFAPFYIAFAAAAAQSAASGASTPPDMHALMPQMMTMQGLSYLVQFGGILLSAVLYCAVARAVLHPERSGFAYMRLGAPELYFAVLTFAAGIVIAIVVLLMTIPFVFAIVILAATKAYAAAIGLGVAGVIALIAVLLYFVLRFAFVVPMMVDDGQFHLFESWTLTKGRVGSLFLIGLGLFGILIGAELVIFAVFLALVGGTLSLIAGGYANLPGFFQQAPMTVVARLAPLLVVMVLAAIPISGCALAVTGAPWARAYRDAARPEGAAAVFS